MSTLVLVTDGSPEAWALARWLPASGANIVEARGPADVAIVVKARRSVATPERIVTIATTGASGDISAADAVTVVRRWLSDLPPIEVRAAGAHLIAERVDSEAAGADTLRSLASLLVPRSQRTTKRGRPPGSDPFRGAGLEVVVMLLLHPQQPWTERALAEAVDRSPYGVHRVLVELGRRGYLVKGTEGSRVRDDLVLRDDLVAAWRGRVTATREAHAYMARNPRRALADVAAAARKRRREMRLAGPSAVGGPEGLVGGPSVLYLEEPDDVMAAAGFRATRAGDIVTWPIVEPAVLLAPRLVGGLPATNRVITYADLMLTPSDRTNRAAQAVWGEG